MAAYQRTRVYDRSSSLTLVIYKDIANLFFSKEKWPLVLSILPLFDYREKEKQVR